MRQMQRPPATRGSLKKRLEGARFVDIGVEAEKHPSRSGPKEPRLKNIIVMVMLNIEVGEPARLRSSSPGVFDI